MVDASRKQNNTLTIAVSILFFLPLLSGVLSRVFKQSRWFGDYGAVACAGEKWMLGEPIYDLHLSCPGMNNAMYIYHPWVAQLFAYPMEALGRTGLITAYAIVYWLAIAALVWIMIGRNSTAPRSKRAWFAAFMTGSAVYWANIAVILHGFLGVAGVLLRKRPSLLVIAIAVAMLVKPLFATFAAVFLLMRKPLLVRLAYALAAVILGIAPSVWALYENSELVQQWRALVEQVVYYDRPGDGYLGWMSLIGAPISSIGVSIGFFAFAGLVTAAGMILATGLDLNDDDRALLGLSLGVLMIPRLMSQDFWLLGPGLAAMMTVLLGFAPGVGKWVQRGFLACCVVALVGSLADVSDYANKAATLVMALLIVFSAVVVAFRQKLGPITLLKRFWSGEAPAAA